MSDENQLNEAVKPEMPYYMTPEFHERLSGVPSVQTVNGERIANVNFMFFKVQDGALVEALVPEDLTIPTSWTGATGGPLANKAMSMLQSN